MLERGRRRRAISDTDGWCLVMGKKFGTTTSRVVRMRMRALGLVLVLVLLLLVLGLAPAYVEGPV